MFSKYCTSTVHGYLTNGPYRVQARAKKTHKKNNNPNGASCKHPMYSPTLAHRKEVRKGLEIEHKSTGVLEIFFHNYWSANHSGKIWISLVYCSLAVWLPFLKQSHSFISHWFSKKKTFREATLDAWAVWHWDIGSYMCDPRTPQLPWKLWGEGRAALPPRSVQIWDKGNNSIQQVNESYSSSHRTACTRRRFRSQMELVRMEKAETQSWLGCPVGFVANYGSWYVPGVTPIRYRQQNAPQHAATRLHLGQEKGRNADAGVRRGYGA